MIEEFGPEITYKYQFNENFIKTIKKKYFKFSCFDFHVCYYNFQKMFAI